MTIGLPRRRALVTLAAATALAGGLAAAPHSAQATFGTCEELEQAIMYHESQAFWNYQAGNTANGDKHLVKADGYRGQYYNNCT